MQALTFWLIGLFASDWPWDEDYANYLFIMHLFLRVSMKPQRADVETKFPRMVNLSYVCSCFLCMFSANTSVIVLLGANFLGLFALDFHTFINKNRVFLHTFLVKLRNLRFLFFFHFRIFSMSWSRLIDGWWQTKTGQECC